MLLSPRTTVALIAVGLFAGVTCHITSGLDDFTVVAGGGAGGIAAGGGGAGGIAGGGGSGGGHAGEGGTVIATCGNGVLENGEYCDDGNTELGDGCSKYCDLEQKAAQCPGAAFLLSALGVSIRGNTDEGDVPRSAICGGAAGPELFFELNSTQTGQLTVTMTCPFTCVLATAAECWNDGSNFCEAGASNVELSVPVQATVPTYLYVGGEGDPDRGPFILDLDFVPQ